jgi:hypothetical protein
MKAAVVKCSLTSHGKKKTKKSASARLITMEYLVVAARTATVGRCPVYRRDLPVVRLFSRPLATLLPAPLGLAAGLVRAPNGFNAPICGGALKTRPNV